MNEFELFGNKIYGDSLYIISSFGKPNEVTYFRDVKYWNYDVKNIKFNFKKKDDKFELFSLAIIENTNNIITINGKLLKKEDYKFEKFKKKLGCGGIGLDPDRDISAYYFLSNKKSMSPTFYFKKGFLNEIIF